MDSNPSISLSGPWKFRIGSREAAQAAQGLGHWMSATVPGTVHYQLQQLGKIEDPYYGQNELDLQWIDQQQWHWARDFTATNDDCARQRQEIIFEGIDTVATILLNGEKIGQSVNMFRQIVCDVRGILRAGKNELLVILDSPTAFAAEQAERAKRRVPLGEFVWVPGESRPTGRAYIRKTQCHFGWDWGVYLATSGIWQNVRLECADGPRIDAVTVRQEHIGPAGAPAEVRLHLTAHLHSYSASEGVLQISCDGKTAQVPLQVQPGETAAQATVVISSPQLWWPNGQGKQPLYDLDVSIRIGGAVVSEMRRRVGLRTLQLDRSAGIDAHGNASESFTFVVNGRPIFAKGANWIPADQFVERCTPAVYAHLLGAMVDANMNMVRVWGGGWYEQNSFYDLCDSLGILVWQDFMMACALYPDTAEFTQELTAEARYQVRRLQHRPSIALWCGDNENMQAVWEWWRDKPEFETNVAIYKKLLGLLKETVESEDPTRTFWISSPCNGDFGETPDNPNFGDVHYWKVWHKREPFSNYLTVKPRFVSEFGFQSFPEPRTIRAVVPTEELNPSSRVMEHHQRSPDGNMLITNTIARELPIPKDFDSYCYASQINQAMAIRTAVEHWRRLRPWCMGAIYWQLNDLWPVASWSSIDYHGRWKALHHFACRFFAPLLPTLVHEGGKLAGWVTSDLPTDVSLQWRIELIAFSGHTLARREGTVQLAAGESRCIGSFGLDELLGGAVPREICAFISISDGSAEYENFTPLVPWKWARLKGPRLDAKLTQSAPDRLQLELVTRQVVPFVHAEIEGVEGHFEGDWQVLRPGRHVLRWQPHTALGASVPTLAEAKERLKIISLYDTFAHESDEAAADVGADGDSIETRRSQQRPTPTSLAQRL